MVRAPLCRDWVEHIQGGEGRQSGAATPVAIFADLDTSSPKQYYVTSDHLGHGFLAHGNWLCQCLRMGGLTDRLVSQLAIWQDFPPWQGKHRPAMRQPVNGRSGGCPNKAKKATVWQANFLPYGGVHAITGAAANCRL